MVSGGSAEPPFTILLGGKVASFVYRTYQDQLTQAMIQRGILQKMTAQEIGEKIINRSKDKTAIEAADELFGTGLVKVTNSYK
jgi:hypothetical protein